MRSRRRRTEEGHPGVCVSVSVCAFALVVSHGCLIASAPDVCLLQLIQLHVSVHFGNDELCL